MIYISLIHINFVVLMNIDIDMWTHTHKYKLQITIILRRDDIQVFFMQTAVLTLPQRHLVFSVWSYLGMGVGGIHR